MQSSNQPITWQQLNAFGHVDGQDHLLKFKRSTGMEKKGDLSTFELGMVVGARVADLII